jgi:GTP-binding protein
MLVDEARIFIRSGKGGGGCVSLRREKYVPKGGPDGGDGGRGGNVVLIADPHLDTLLPLTHAPHNFAANGQPGEARSRHGANGEDKLIRLPLGTLVRDEGSGEVIADVSEPDVEFVVAMGGKGGYGNEHFKSATNQTPRDSTPGGDCVERTLLLELKLIADIGLLGMPNAGKSTLLSAVSRARPKIADYPFTTLSPQPGIAELPGERRMVIADIPGLIEGAADGAGLGHEFLRHVERTKILLHLVDVLPPDGEPPHVHYHAIRGELASFDAVLAEKPEIVVLNKIDLVPEVDRAETVARFAAGIDLPSKDILIMSGATKEGTREMLETAWAMLQEMGDEQPAW